MLNKTKSNLWNKLFIVGIKSFSWSDYGLNSVEETLSDPGAQEWITGLADHLESIIGNYVNGKIDV